MGRFCKEKQHADKLEQKLNEIGIEYKRELRIIKKERFIENIIDFMIEDCVVIDLKAKKFVTKDDFYQMKRYLISLNKKLGLIVNFRDDFIKTKRVLNK